MARRRSPRRPPRQRAQVVVDDLGVVLLDLVLLALIDLDDADLEDALLGCARGRLSRAGRTILHAESRGPRPVHGKMSRSPAGVTTFRVTSFSTVSFAILFLSFRFAGPGEWLPNSFG